MTYEDKLPAEEVVKLIQYTKRRLEVYTSAAEDALAEYNTMIEAIVTYTNDLEELEELLINSK
jgi:hypothetical protein